MIKLTVQEQAPVDLSVEALRVVDAVSPTVQMVRGEDGVTITIHDLNGDHTAKIYDGEIGPRGETGSPGPKGDPGEVSQAEFDELADEVSDLNQALSQKYEKPVTGIPASDLESGVIPAVPVQDVQIDGTSILNNGVANVPIASQNNFGVAKVYSAAGIEINSLKQLTVRRAIDVYYTKQGNDGYRFIPTYAQHLSAFFGLAKAAGADMASLSDVTVGTYPEAQKVAIQKMLGIYEPPYELVNEFTLDSERGIDLSADLNNAPYNFGNVLIRFYYPANTATASSGYGRYRFYDSNGKFTYCETGKYNTSTSACYKLIHVIRKGNITMTNFVPRTTTGSSGAWSIKDMSTNSIYFDLGNIVHIANVSGDVEPSGTQIKIYAQWAY